MHVHFIESRWDPVSGSNCSFPVVQTLAGRRWWRKDLGPCCPDARARFILVSWLQFGTACLMNIWIVTEKMEDLSLSICLSPHFCVCVCLRERERKGEICLQKFKRIFFAFKWIGTLYTKTENNCVCVYFCAFM